MAEYDYNLNSREREEGGSEVEEQSGPYKTLSRKKQRKGRKGKGRE